MTTLKNALKWTGLGLGGLIGILLTLAVLFSFATELGIYPSTRVQTGEDLPEKQYNALRKANILERNETVQFYYSDALFDITQSGSMMTNRRVLGYWVAEDENGNEKRDIHAYPLDKIDTLTLIEAGGEYLDATYEITALDDDEFTLLIYLSVEDDHHLNMIAALETQIAKNTPKPAEVEE